MKVAVIGLGAAGLSVAAALAEDGHEVWGFERSPQGPARGSSRGDSRIMRVTPGEGEAYVDLVRSAIESWRALQVFSSAPLIKWTGGHMAGPDGSAFVRSCISLAKKHERPFRLMGSADVRRATQGGLSIPDDWVSCWLEDCGVINAEAAVAAFVAKAKAAGARLNWQTPVQKLSEDGGLIVDSSRLYFDRRVVAAGPWVVDLVPTLGGYLNPLPRTVAWFASASASAPAMPLFCFDDRSGTYGMQTPDGSYKLGVDGFGAEHLLEPLDTEGAPSANDIARIEDLAHAYLPHHVHTAMRSDKCYYTVAADLNFVLDDSLPDTLVMSCCSGHGFKYTSALGAIAADWVADRSNPHMKVFSRGDGRAIHAVATGGSASKPT